MSQIDTVISTLEKAHKRPLLVYRYNKAGVYQQERITSGSIGLDVALGGGFVRGSINEIIGPESTSKTTLCLTAAAHAQKLGYVLFVDQEHSFDPIYAKAIGVDVDNLLFCQPDYAEQAFDIIEALVATGELSLVVVDSVASLTPQAELQGDPGDAVMGVAAKMNNQHLRKILPVAHRTKTTLLYINHIKYKLGKVFGNPETTSGGTGFKMYSSTRIDMRKVSTQTEAQKTDSIRVKAKVIKNKTAAPYRTAEFEVSFGKGINREAELLDLALSSGSIEQKGAWFYIGEDKFQGREAVLEHLTGNEALETKILEAGGIKCSSTTPKEQ